jgi:3-oxoadipate enol-lactonase
MGGFIGMRVALRHPEMIRSLVLIDTTARAEDPDKVERYEAFRQVLETDGIERVLPAMPPIFLKDEFIAAHPEAVEGWFEMLRRSDPQGVARASRGVDARDDISDQLGAISVPTLVIHGTEDAAIELEKAEELAHLVPGARFATIEGAGHQSNVDSPEDVSRLVREFLASVPAAV